MSDDLVTAIIPTFNYGRFVTQAVDSALAQSYRNLEIMVVDDGSDDDTREQLAPYGERIRYLYQKNQSVAAARNTGIRAATGNLIAFLDADDIWHPQKIELQMRCLANHPEAGIVAVDRLPEGAVSWPMLNGSTHLKARSITVDELVLRPLFAPSGVLVRKQCFEVAGYFDPEFRNAEDYDMWIRIASHFPIVKLEIPLWWYRVHGSNKSHIPARQEAAALKVLDKTFAKSSPLRNRFLLRQKAYSYAAYAAAQNFTSVGRELPASMRILRSVLLWPLPYRRQEVATSLARPKKLLIALLRMLRLMPRAAPRISANPPNLPQPSPHREAVQKSTM
ncbi:MAG TPA: glycosyltransferase family 2 protein [Gemmataceae bacterium]|nr:glycosyltransferase family 2 protein [Gemmataceae bacterium]